MPYLKAILVNANDKSNRMLRAKSMECISLVGMAVGKDKFRNDAKQVITNIMFSLVIVLMMHAFVCWQMYKQKIKFLFIILTEFVN